MPGSRATASAPLAPNRLTFLESRWAVAAAGAVIALAALATYHNSISVPFLFDDVPAITANPSIRHLWLVRELLSPPLTGNAVVGRPLVNVTLAFNYAIGGTAVESYHAFNLAVHLLAGLTLFGVVRRTLRRPVLTGRFGGSALPLALAVAVLWTVHPLQTESVTFVVQRTESLMGLFYLLTLYGFIRSAESTTPGQWHTLAIAACLLGMATKEVMVSAPLMVLLYDRTFVSGSFRAAWQKRRPLYLGLAGTWILLGYLVASTGANRGGTAGLGADITWWTYALTQCQAILHYLWLTVWPNPLLIDYGTAVVTNPVAVVPQGLILLGLVAGTATALHRWPAAGFAGAWFFAILAPSSSVMPLLTQTVAEHRMYLPLAAVIALGVVGMQLWTGRRSLVVCLALAVGWGWLSVRRNEDYRSSLILWGDTVRKSPGNARAHFNLANCLSDTGRLSEAVEEYAATLRIRPVYAEAENNLGTIWYQMGRAREAISHYQAALKIDPDSLQTHINLGHAFVQTGRLPEGISHYQAALRIDPRLALVHVYWGTALAQADRLSEALLQLEAALRIDPDLVQAHATLAAVLIQLGRPSTALPHFEAVVRIMPNSAEAHNYLGNGLLRVGRLQEARQEYEKALRLRPDFEQARLNLARLQAGGQSVGPGH